MRVDLNNINFLIPLDDVVPFKFLTENGFNFLNEEVPVVSKISDSTYGIAYFADDKIMFCKHKAVELNKGKQSPKTCTFIQKTCKIISQEEFEKYFRKTNSTEVVGLEMEEEKDLFHFKPITSA